MLSQMIQGTGLSEALTQSPILAFGGSLRRRARHESDTVRLSDDPITASVLAGTVGQDARRSRVVGLTLTYALGMALFYALLGLLAGMTGSLFGAVSASPWTRFAIANLLLVFGLVMFDVIPISAPRRLLQWASGLGGGSYPAVFLLGGTSGIVAAPCGAPAFAVILTWVAATQSGVMGFLYLFIFSLGMMALLVGVGLFSGFGTVLPAAGPWMSWIKKAAGVVMLMMAEYYFVQVGMVL